MYNLSSLANCTKDNTTLRTMLTNHCKIIKGRPIYTRFYFRFGNMAQIQFQCNKTLAYLSRKRVENVVHRKILHLGEYILND